MRNSQISKGPLEKKRRQENAAARKVEISPSDQLAILDDRLGEGVGAVKERKRLAKKVEKSGK